MNKKLVALGTSALLLVFPLAALAFGGQPGPVNIIGAIDNILGSVWVIFTAVAVLAFLIAGFMFLTSRGDPSGVSKARDAVIWGAAGVVVAIIAFSVVGIIRLTLGA